MNLQTVENSLYDWVYSIVTPVVCAWLDQTMPRPAANYIGMRHSAWRKFGATSAKTVNASTGVISSADNFEFTFSLIGYGTAISAILLIVDGIQKEIVLRSLSNANIAYINTIGMFNAPVVLGNHFEQRLALDLLLRVNNKITYSDGLIETVDYGLTVKEGSRVVFTDNTI
jgi:hypothetical protein